MDVGYAMKLSEPQKKDDSIKSSSVSIDIDHVFFTRILADLMALMIETRRNLLKT